MAAGAGPPHLEVGVLGPLRVAVDGAVVDVPGPKRRAVLALLALAEGRVVTVDQILDALWPDAVLDAGRAAVHTHISRVRRHLGPAAGRLQRVAGGYRLDLAADGLDAARAAKGLDAARGLAARDPAAASRLLREVRALWRGRSLADLTEVMVLASRAVTLDELRRQVDDLLVECALAADDAPSVLGVASEAVADEPLRETAVLLLVRVLAVTGRTPEALRAAYDYRRRLRDEAGLEPSPALGELERALASGGSGSEAGAARPHRRLPLPATPFIGRESEVAALERLLSSDRIVTIVGPGGVGKSRLALEVASRHEDVRFLPLAPVTAPEAIPHALAGALDLDNARGDVLGACITLLDAGPQLLVVDNCEHVLAAARDVVADLLESCPALTVLTTSREPLGLAAERQVRLSPLALPDPSSKAPDRAPAVAVFMDRARRARPDFAPTGEDLVRIADIVRSLDGLPLSIELAAGRLSSFGVADLHARLDRSLDLLGDARTASEDRHRTLRAVVQWSYELLPEPERRLFRHLAVFPDGVDLATAETVAEDLGLHGDVGAAIAHLVDASMVDADLDGRPRYRLLETLRTFGLDRLEAEDERDEAEARLLRWAVDLGRWADAVLHTADEAVVNARLRRELTNLRAAWRLARDRDAIDAAIDLVVALEDASTWRDLPEVWEWAEELARDPAVERHHRGAAALAAAAECAWMQGRIDRSDELARRALDLAQDDEGRWRALLAQAVADMTQGRYGDGVAHGLEAATLAPRPAHATWVAALSAAYAGELERAEQIAAMASPESPTLRAEQAYVAGECASIAGRGEEAERHYRRAIEIAEEVEATFVVGIAALGLVSVQAETGRVDEALRGYRDLVAYWERAGNWIQVWTTLRNLAVLLRRLGEEDAALHLEDAADRAPEAPAVSDAVWQERVASRSGRRTGARRRRAGAESTPAVLDVARDAIDRALARRPARAT